jgi:CRISPR/Cas system CSM-associated protein Csm4 (group 5 of RAMP superfamily)
MRFPLARNGFFQGMVLVRADNEKDALRTLVEALKAEDLALMDKRTYGEGTFDEHERAGAKPIGSGEKRFAFDVTAMKRRGTLDEEKNDRAWYE